MNSNIGLDYKINVSKLIMLKHKPFAPQISAALEANIKTGTLDTIHRTLDRGVGLKGELNTILANSLDNNISRGRVSQIVNGWNSERFSFLLVVEILNMDNTIRAEEIYQGYTDRAEHTLGNLYAGAQVDLDPDTSLHINKVISILYGRDSNGNLVPRFDRASSMLSANDTYDMGEKLTVLRPIDLSTGFLSRDIKAKANLDIEVINDTPILGGISKFSNVSNEAAGRLLTKLVTSANTSRNMEVYTAVGVESTANYESMINELPEDTFYNNRFLSWMSLRTGRHNISNFTLGELMSNVHNVNPMIATVESYNDSITKMSSAALNFNGDNDNGDSMLVDNQLTRFHKKIIPYLFNAMLSFGFIHFAGRLTNKTFDGSIQVDHTLLLSVSNVVNTNVNIRGHLLNLFYQSLQSLESREVISGGGVHEVEMVFDLSLTDSIVSVNLNGNIHKIRIPSMADSNFSSLIATRTTSDIITNDLYGVVDNIMNIQKDYSSSMGGNNTGWDKPEPIQYNPPSASSRVNNNASTIIF